MLRYPFVLAGVLLASGCATHHAGEAVAVEAKRIDVAELGDACRGAAGYAEFRARLERVVAARDGDGFRALFHPDGAMRVNSVGGRANTPDWGFSRPEAKAVWSGLDKILALGCARSGERLVLPATAMFTDLEVGVELIVVRDDTIRLAPQASAKAIRRATRGEVLRTGDELSPEGWTTVLVDGVTGYLPKPAVRSPYDIRMELVPYEGSWRIREFGSGV